MYIKNSFFQNVAKSQSLPVPSYIVFVIRCNVIFISIKALYIDEKARNHTMCLVLPLCGVLAILKNKKKFGFFSIANLVVSYFEYIFEHRFTSKLKIKSKDKEIKKKLFDSEENISSRDSNSRSLILEASALTTALWKI